MSKYLNEKKRMLKAEKIIGKAIEKNIKTIENNCRSSAVICLIFYENNKLNILLTKRSEKLVNHAGEISFPGGKVESFIFGGDLI